MKLKSFVLTALSLACLGLSARPASAWWLGLHRCGCNRYSTIVVCRPYNAFTPVCSGSMVCDGCCPFACPNCGPGACCSPALGNPMLSMFYDPAGVNGFAQAQPMMMAPGAMPVPAQQFQAPAPVPTQQTQAPMNWNVQPAAYQQGYSPMYYPMNMNTYQQVPAYWYQY
jgi:hypothetical protein